MSIYTGSSREVLSVMWRNAGRLAALAALPVLAFAATSFAILWFMRRMFERIGAMAADPAAQPGPEQVMPLVGGMIQMQGVALLGQVAAGMALVYMAVKAIRLHLTDGRDGAPFRVVAYAALYFFLYSMGIYLLTMFAALLPGVLFMGLAGGLVYYVMGSGEPGPGTIAAAAAVALPLILAWMLFPLWFGCRFAVGLPAVAMGKTPDVFRDLWPLARGASFGVPLRLFAAYLLMLLMLAPFAAIAAYQMYGAVMTLGPNPQPQDIFALQSDMFTSLMWTLPVFVAPSIVYMLYSSLLLAEAYRRLTGRGS